MPVRQTLVGLVARPGVQDSGVSMIDQRGQRVDDDEDRVVRDGARRRPAEQGDEVGEAPEHEVPQPLRPWHGGGS